MLRDCALAPDPSRDVQSAGPDDAALAQLLDVHFDGRPGLLHEFPLLLGSENRVRCRVLRDGCGGYRAHAAWRPLELATSHGRLRAAGIGMVTTHRAWRGQGLASRVVEDCLEAARGEGCDLALLFGAVRGLYARLGFRPAGRERWSRLAPASVPALCDARVRAGSPDEAPRLLALQRSQPLRVERSARELERLLAIPDTHVHVLERAGEASAYAIEGKGRDLQGVVHEWAGAPGDVAALLGALAARPDAPLWIVSPAGGPTPPGVGAEERFTPLAQLRILRPERCGGEDPEQVFGSGPRAGARELYLWGLDSV